MSVSAGGAHWGCWAGVGMVDGSGSLAHNAPSCPVFLVGHCITRQHGVSLALLALVRKCER